MWDAVIDKLNREEKSKRRWVPEFIQPTVEEVPSVPLSSERDLSSDRCVVDFGVLA
jgi:hypothetical protein